MLFVQSINIVQIAFVKVMVIALVCLHVKTFEREGERQRGKGGKRVRLVCNDYFFKRGIYEVHLKNELNIISRYKVNSNQIQYLLLRFVQFFHPGCSQAFYKQSHPSP